VRGSRQGKKYRVKKNTNGDGLGCNTKRNKEDLANYTKKRDVWD
jgi:hypothetical protein